MTGKRDTPPLANRAGGLMVDKSGAATASFGEFLT
jgi:bifunctional ADP-heptose synthase (sugar kinase/adenylyltransferase)